VLTNRHPHTLSYILWLANLLLARGSLAEAEQLFREALEGHAVTLGAEHKQTKDDARSLVKLLRHLGRQTEAEGIAAQYKVEA